MTYGVPSEKERQRWLRPASRDTPGPYFDLGIIVFCLLFACLSLVV